MNGAPLLRRVGSMFALLTGLLAGCAVSTPFPRANLPAHAANDRVVLVLTRVFVNTEDRAEFDRQTNRVIASLPSYPGLIAFSARRQLFGNTGWTMTVWASDEARARFVQSAVHQEAIAKSMPTLLGVELKRLTLARKDLPTDWQQAIALLDQPEGRRNYWE